MTLGELVSGVYRGVLPETLRGLAVPAVWDDSRRVTHGSLFVAMRGALRTGDDFIEAAMAAGAKVVLLDRASEARFAGRYPGVAFLGVEDPSAAFRVMVDRFYGHPSSRVRVIGITGTNGKTTISYFLESVIAAAGKRSGVVGTVNCRIGGEVIPSRNTTPGLLDNQKFLAGLAAKGIGYAVMEVSSHALDQGRVDNIDFRGGIFTNLTGDHLDYHKTMEGYFEAKSRLFRGLGPDAYAVINTDDEYGRRLLSMTRARVFSYGLRSPADLQADIKKVEIGGTRFKVRFAGKTVELRTHFIGYHNIYNMLAAFAAGIAEGLDPETVKRGIESLEHVPGRLERVETGRDYCVFIDYAHTDDGLKNVLQCLKQVPHRRIIVVFGCGGDRDRTKRPRMGRAAGELADYSILTSDNPRSEDPEAIIREIVAGFSGNDYEVVVDRKEAIRRALALAASGDIVLLAGKGHETEQIFKDRTVEFRERDIVAGILAEKGVAA
ncbi:MAG: UDP-N-acetylmuramoyl-L-alanyl-D-glutamate--2,6-diaminopimelate ligase [Candidatus Omnitrophica bacterium]|nr:UDP-N-acetylmuramoyl-L-alanyl-D-glutamate--2,6-diaminopimelate ligase [Candidatus Omnitrophota bacterium]